MTVASTSTNFILCISEVYSLSEKFYISESLLTELYCIEVNNFVANS